MNPKKPEEYRPINALPALEKIIEKVVYFQLHKYFEKSRILTKFQSGFRKAHSCESAFQYLLNDWRKAVDNNSTVAVVFLDLKRAFETVDRIKLIKKLQGVGVGGTVLQWVKNYLTGRKQQVKCKDMLSDHKFVNIGVPQGSILGPLLFIFYINDIINVMQHCKLHMFADDTIVYIEDDKNNHDNMIKLLNKDLIVVEAWLRANKLKLNINKTKVMILAREVVYKKFVDENVVILIDDSVIEVVNEIKYLGFIIDRHLKFRGHIDYLCKKIAMKVGVLSRCSRFLTVFGRLTVFNTIILPHYLYSALVIYIADKADIHRLQVLQNKAMRFILKCSRLTRVNDMLCRLHWLNVYQFSKFQTLVFIHKMRLGVVPSYLSESTQTFDSIHRYNTRGKCDFYLDHKNRKSGQNSVFFKGLYEYNNLNSNLKKMPIHRFKREVKDLLFNNSVNLN